MLLSWGAGDMRIFCFYRFYHSTPFHHWFHFASGVWSSTDAWLEEFNSLELIMVLSIILLVRFVARREPLEVVLVQTGSCSRGLRDDCFRLKLGTGMLRRGWVGGVRSACLCQTAGFIFKVLLGLPALFGLFMTPFLLLWARR